MTNIYYNSEGLKMVEQEPVGYISLVEFAKRCNVGKSAITNAKKAGTLNRDYMCVVKKPGGKLERLFLDWAELGPAYIGNLPKHKQPESFKVTEKIKRDTAPKKPAANQYTNNEEQDYNPNNLDSIKRKKELLAVQKAELELQKAKNEVIDRSILNNTVQYMAQLIKRKHETLSIRIGPMFATETNTEKIKSAYIREVKEMLGEIQKELKQYEPPCQEKN